MAELLPCPFCGGEARRYYGHTDCYGITCKKCSCKIYGYANKANATRAWNTRAPKERGADKPKVTCLNCNHLMFSDMYGECSKQLKIVNPSDTCEYAEPKERGGEK